MGKLGIGNVTTVIVYDEFGGSWAARLWWALMYYGHDNVKILNGGLGKWKAEGREIETEASAATPTVFEATTQASLIAGIKNVEQAIEQDNIYLVDALNADHQINRYEDIRQLIDAAKSFMLSECICRKEKALGGHPCEHTLETCLSFSMEEEAYDSLPFQRGKIISKDKALKVLVAAEKEGLVHCTFNVQDGQTFVCLLLLLMCSYERVERV
jgi:hypothetical protein